MSLHRRDKNGASKVKLVDQKGFEKSLQKASFLKASSAGLPSSPEDLIELTYSPNAVTLDQPLCLGFQVLQLAKIHLLKFYHDFLAKYLDDSMFENMCSDTDSLYVALAGETLRDCVPPRLHAEFDEASKTMLVTPELPDSRFTLGNYKLEMEGTRMVCLTSKCYVIENEDDGSLKASSKGVSKVVNESMINFDSYRKILEDEFRDGRGESVIPLTKNPMIQTNRAGDRMYTIQSHKKGLTSLEVKRYYMPDGIHSRPHLFV